MLSVCLIWLVSESTCSCMFSNAGERGVTSGPTPAPPPGLLPRLRAIEMRFGVDAGEYAGRVAPSPFCSPWARIGGVAPLATHSAVNSWAREINTPRRAGAPIGHVAGVLPGHLCSDGGGQLRRVQLRTL